MKQIYLVLTISFLLVGCGGSSEVQKYSDSKEISVPFSESKYLSNNDYFRAKQNGKSPDLATAKKIAMLNAKTALAGSIKSTIKSVTDQYTNQVTVGDKVEFENKFEELSRDVIDQALNDVRVVGDKIFEGSKGGYTYWVAIEMSTKPVLEGVTTKISKDDKLKLDYDKKKFEEIFNKEMEKLSNEK